MAKKYTVPEYRELIIPGVKEKAISSVAVWKQIQATLDKKSGIERRAKGLPKGVSVKKMGRFYLISVTTPKNVKDGK